jgi:hypothetical protein
MVRAALGRAEPSTVTKNFDRCRHTVTAAGTRGRASRSPARAVSGYANHCAQTWLTPRMVENLGCFYPIEIAQVKCILDRTIA